MGAIRIPAKPATIAPSTQFQAPRRLGDNPERYAPRSVSAAALVANPKFVNRKNAHSAAASATTTTANHTRSDAMRTSPTVQMSDGRTPSTLIGRTPSRTTISPVSAPRSPSEATALPRMEARRSGRKTTR